MDGHRSFSFFPTNDKPHRYVVSKKPKTISHINAAGVPLAAMTAFQCLADGGLTYPPNASSKSKKVFVSGGPGGVGIFAIQLAKVMFGVGQVVTTASASKVETCKKLGADEVVDYTKDSFEVALKGREFDVCVDCTHESWKMMSIVKRGGGVISITQAPTQDALLRWIGNMGDNPVRSKRGTHDRGERGWTDGESRQGITVGKGVLRAVNGLPSPVIELFTGALFFHGRAGMKGAKFNHLITRPNHNDLDEIAKHLDKITVVLDSVCSIYVAVGTLTTTN